MLGVEDGERQELPNRGARAFWSTPVDPIVNIGGSKDVGSCGTLLPGLLVVGMTRGCPGRSFSALMQPSSLVPESSLSVLSRVPSSIVLTGSKGSSMAFDVEHAAAG